jgi:hypothetical protein
MVLGLGLFSVINQVEVVARWAEQQPRDTRSKAGMDTHACKLGTVESPEAFIQWLHQLDTKVK